MPKRLKKASQPATDAPTFQEQLSAHMAKLGAKGGKISGAKRMTNLTKAQRSEIARMGGLARSAKKRPAR